MSNHDLNRVASEVEAAGASKFSPNFHPTDEQLIEFVMGRLVDQEVDHIADHLVACDRCARQIDHVAPPDDPLLIGLRHAASIDNNEAPTRPGSVADSTPRRQRFSGRQIGKYQVIEQLGRGGMGIVYRAHDPVLDREVALKVLRVSGDDACRTRFLAEARAAAKLAHPNVVTAFDCGVEDDNCFLAMELIVGGSAADRLAANGVLPWKTATQIALQAARGLHAAHQAGLIHRDVKPANLLLSDDGQIKVADFGLVKTIKGQRLTNVGEIVGSPHYMSPEQCESQPADHRSDIYSLGATYYSLLTGQKPYEERSSLLEIIAAHCRSPAPNPCDVDNTVPKECARLVQRAMAKSPNERFGSCADMESALDSLLNSVRRDSRFQKTMGVGGAGVLERRTRRAVLIGVGLSLIGLVALASFFYSDDRPSSNTPTSGLVEAVDVDRHVAVRVLELGGTVEIRDGNVDTVIRQATKLPDRPFSLVWIALEHNPHADDDLLGALTPLQQLDGISLRGTAVTDTGMRHMSEISSLTAVFLSDTAVSDDGVLALARLPNLSRLHLDRTRITDRTLQGLQNASLTELALDGTRITNDGLVYVSAMQSLQALTLRQTLVSDDGIHQMRTLTGLQRVCIADTKTTDAGLRHFHGMTTLMRISVSDPSSSESLVSSDGIAELRVALPNCELEFK